MNAPVINLLVVDDEPSLRRVLRTSLGATGFSVREAPTGEAALGTIERDPADLVLLDINMPGMGGIETCRRIRRLAPQTGIVMISVRGQEGDKVRALEAGADDYVTKPFRFRELLARLRAVYRRMHPVPTARPGIVRAGDLELDLEHHMLAKGGEPIRLSPKEFEILSYLMRHPNTPIPHARLLQAIWGVEYGGETEYLRTYVRHLRKKIEPDADKPQYLLTEPWVGYRFCEPSEAAAPDDPAALPATET